MAATIYLYDSIGWSGISARDFANTLQQLQAQGEKKFVLRINSPGGSVFDGFAIYNLVRELDCTVVIDGLAASIASVIALAGKQVVMNKIATFMIHNPWMMTAGDAAEFAKAGLTLDMIGKQIASVYQEKTGKEYETVKAWMDAERYFTSEEAKAEGFVDTVQAQITEKNFVAMYVATDVEDSNNSHKNGKDGQMNKRLLAFLGLPENATEEQINAKLAEVSGKAGLAENVTLEQLLAALQAGDQEPLAAKPEIAQLAAQVKQLADVVTALATQNANDAVNALVDGAIADGKVLPADKDMLVIAATADFKKVKSMLDGKAKGSAVPAAFKVDGAGTEEPKVDAITKAALFIKEQKGGN